MPTGADRDTGPPCNRILADECLQTTVRAAVAAGAIGIDGDVPELSAVPVGTAEELAAHEDAAADTHLAEDADEVLEIARDPLPVLGERGEVGLVVGADGEAVQP